jgi:hypothetical protein
MTNNISYFSNFEATRKSQRNKVENIFSFVYLFWGLFVNWGVKINFFWVSLPELENG